MSFKSISLLLLLTIGALAPVAAEEDSEKVIDQSLWEVGLVGAELYVPDYPAAGQKHNKWLIAPYAIYRGKILRADREGARARFLHKRRFDVEMSFSGSLATKSEDNEARHGMPDLNYLVEAGPRLSWLLSRLSGKGSVRLFLPLRAVFSSDLHSIHYTGLTYGPVLYTQREPFLLPGWIGILQFSSRFGNRQLNAMYYDVAPEFSKPDRPAYDAQAGYQGADLFAGVALPIGLRWRLFTGGQFYYHGGAANHASPLFKRETDYSVGIGLSYAFFRSVRLAQP